MVSNLFLASNRFPNDSSCFYIALDVFYLGLEKFAINHGKK